MAEIPVTRLMVNRLLLPVCLALLAGCGNERAPAPGNGTPAPAFSAQVLDGNRVRVPDDFRGRVVALRFWADWCPYCRTEMADLQPVYTRLAPQGLEILAVNVAQDADTARAFVRPLGIRYPVLLDPEGATARAWGVQVLPITWLLDRQGVVRGKIVGEATPEAFEARVKALLDAD
ncbi:MAG: TlpA disulfide reductase family protein [Pseudomonadota bacterium]